MESMRTLFPEKSRDTMAEPLGNKIFPVNMDTVSLLCRVSVDVLGSLVMAATCKDVENNSKNTSVNT